MNLCHNYYVLQNNSEDFNILLTKRKPQMRLSMALTSILTCVVLLSFAQTKAVTENGDEALLFDDGTWKSLDDNPTMQ